MPDTCIYDLPLEVLRDVFVAAGVWDAPDEAVYTARSVSRVWRVAVDASAAVASALAAAVVALCAVRSVEVHGTPNRALQNACRHGRCAVARHLLLSVERGGCGAHADYDSSVALGCFREASGEGNAPIARLLLQQEHHAARANDRRGAALCRASDIGDEGLVRLLLGYAIDPAPAGSRRGLALVAAAARGHGHIVSLLLASPSAPTANCRNGAAVVVAARAGHAAVVVTLLRAERSPARSSSWEGGALVLAAKYGHADVVQVLLGYVTIPASVDRALVLAAACGHEGVVSLLLRVSQGRFRVRALAYAMAMVRAADGAHMRVLRLLLSQPDADSDAALLDAMSSSSRAGLEEALADEDDAFRVYTELDNDAFASDEYSP
jgi:ankyrin repeat protein